MLLSTLLFTVGCLSLPHQCRAELHVDHQTVADRLQLCCKAVSDFILSSSLHFLWGVRLDKFLKVDESCFSSPSVIAAGCTRHCGSLLGRAADGGLVGSSSRRGLVLHLWLNALLRHYSPSLRRVLNLIAYCNLALFMPNSTFNPTCADNGSVNE